jgi:peptidoglycan/LPS O-acetylase OafA/YrhL
MQRSHLMDGLRVLAAHLIVVHHLASYGPLADLFANGWPNLHSFFYTYGRMATQVFLVMAGFLSAQSLLVCPGPSWPSLLLKRYWRLVPAYAVAIIGVTVVVWLSRPTIQSDWLTVEPSWLQFLAHLFLVQDIVGQPSMSVGVWYVAMDFQLFFVLCLVFWLASGGRGDAQLSDPRVWGVSCVATLLCLSSQWFFNRDPVWDRWAFYFFESYGLGVLLACSKRLPQVRWLMLLCMTSAFIAFSSMPRPRLLLSVLMVVVLMLWGAAWQPNTRLSNLLQRMSDTTYSMFLSHFMVLVLANAFWIGLGGQSENAALVVLLMAWIFSAWFGGAFHDLVETLMRWCWPRRR